jgi:hypothetical protein
MINVNHSETSRERQQMSRGWGGKRTIAANPAGICVMQPF